jgi:hypothetical protein
MAGMPGGVMGLLQQNPQLLRALGMGGGGGMPGGAGPPTQPGPGQGMSPPPAMGGPPGMSAAPMGSPPGPMANPSGIMAPAGGASNAPAAPNPQEPTGESPNQQPPQNALPHFPRNRFGAMLLPQGGQVGGNSGAPPNPSSAFNWQNMLGQFLQRRNQGGGAAFGQGAGGAPQQGPPTVSGM